MPKEDNIFLFSVIVPVFNAEATIEGTLQSISQSSYRNIEIIVVDDGSTDGTARVIQEMARNDSRIKYFYQENQGPSAARNRGVLLANGEYILFVDSDDRLLTDAISILDKTVRGNRCGLVAFDFAMTNGNRADLVNNALPAEGLYSAMECRDFLYRRQIGNYIWSYCFSTKLFSSVHFPKQIRMMEDAVFMNGILHEDMNVYVLNKTLYVYSVRPGSLSSGMNIEKIRQGAKALSMIQNIDGDQDGNSADYAEYMTRMYLFLIRSLFNEKNNRSFGKKLVQQINYINNNINIFKTYSTKDLLKILFWRVYYLI